MSGPSGGRLAPAGFAAAAVVLAALLSGCGIRDMSLPVDAGVAASRTACPPAPDAVSSRLASTGSGLLPGGRDTAGPTDVPTALPTPLAPAQASAAQAASAAEAARKELLRKLGSDGATAAAAATPTPTPTATSTDGILTCLLTASPSAVTSAP